jgi:hypothetical protein
MTPDTFSQIINMGAAGAVIIVVWLFIHSNEKRDREWRDFFVRINEANTEDMKKNTDVLSQLVEGVNCLKQDIKEHDEHVDERVRQIQAEARTIKRITKRSSEL